MQPFFRSDLAIETAEMFQKSEPLQGVRIEKVYSKQTGIRTTRVIVENEIGAKQLGKSVGSYITLDVPDLDQKDRDYQREITGEIIKQMRTLISEWKHKKILVVGLGNRQMAPDALGPLVIEHLLITRHLIKNYGNDSEVTKGLGCVSALAPGVMAQTGMETREIILGAIRETMPDLLVVIDALAARSVERLNKTIQITDTGIAPGAGIGNRRHGIDAQSMGIPVIALGIPTVIDAASIVSDSMEQLLLQRQLPENSLEHLENYDEEKRYRWVCEWMPEEIRTLFVTPKNIDEIMEQMSYTLSEALNELCHPLM